MLLFPMELGSEYFKSLVFPFFLVEVWSVTSHEDFGGVLLWCVARTVEAEAALPNGFGLLRLFKLEEHCATAF